MQKIPFVDLHAQYLSIRAEIDAAIAARHRAARLHRRPVRQSISRRRSRRRMASSIASPWRNGTDAIYVALRDARHRRRRRGDHDRRTAGSRPRRRSRRPARGRCSSTSTATTRSTRRRSRRRSRRARRRSSRCTCTASRRDMDAICAIWRSAAACCVIEDCAQAHLAPSSSGQRVGTFGDAATLQLLSGQESRRIRRCRRDRHRTTRSWPTRCRMFANHGALMKHEHQMKASTAGWTACRQQCSQRKLPHLAAWTRARQQLARRYDELLADIPERGSSDGASARRARVSPVRDPARRNASA